MALRVRERGFVWGSVLPPVAVVASRRWQRASGWSCFFAGLCLVGNGAYLLGGAIEPVGDVADLVAMDVPRWLLAVLGAGTLAGGLWIWHGLGRRAGRSHPPADEGGVSGGPRISSGR